MKPRHSAAWAGAAVVALVATAGCGTKAAEGAAEAVDRSAAIMAALTRATDRADQVGSAQVEMTTDLGTGTPIAMDGTYSWGDGYAYDVQMDTKASQMQTLQDAPTIRTLLVDGAYYYDVDPQPSGPLAGKEWMKVDASAVFGEQGAQALSGSSGSPVASLKGLKYAEDVDDLGTETVDGKRTTHYRATIDSSRMGKFKDALGDENGLLGATTGGVDSITVDIWVGDDDLPVRILQVMGAMKVTVDFEKFGATAEVKAPPAAQTGDLTEAIKDASGR
ncbi:lipoprotein [Streptomyces phaeofaciens JCM 4814]|uniref:Lipoprotein n=1 Tax=Streptomyces phaeofaciens TaxID=68254 RepID=A0A918LQZ5_9ACTN|nr:hypothetical protein [Streptomyces phaeofaciens]GGT41161.1 putative lipoprotein [Streptomyces phaeofaciens]